MTLTAAHPSTGAVPAPVPPDEVDAARWRHTALRRRMLVGEWIEDARQRQASFFAASVRAFLPDPEISRNAFLACTQAVSVLYDTVPVVTAQGEQGPADSAEVAKVATARWAAGQQDTVLYVQGLNECLVRVDWSTKEKRLRHRTVTPDYVVARSDPDAPDIPTGVSELRPRRRNGKRIWTWEHWDWGGDYPDGRILIETADGEMFEGEDITREVLGEKWDGKYPYMDAQGPIPAYVLYHRRIGSMLWSPYRGHEMVLGTLTSSALWTFWEAGVRDGGHPQRVVINGRILGKKTKARAADGTETGAEFIEMNPTKLLQIVNDGDKQASIDQYLPAQDAEKVAAALSEFDAGLSIYQGLTPADLTRGTANVSGYSIVVSRDGQRRAQQRIEPPMREGDRMVMAVGARMSNAYGGTSLPTNPEAWTITYAEVPKTIEEVRAENEQIDKDLDKKITSRVGAYQKRHPGTDLIAALRALLEVDVLERVVESFRTDVPQNDQEIQDRVDAARAGALAQVAQDSSGGGQDASGGSGVGRDGSGTEGARMGQGEASGEESQTEPATAGGEG